MNLSLTAPQRLVADVYARLPENLHYTGEPTEWTRVTRPGQRLVAFLEGAVLAADGRLWLVDVPHGRIFSVGDNDDWRVELQYDGEPHAVLRLDDGALLIADYRRGLLRFAPGSSEPVEYLRGANTEHFRGLGEMARAPNGDIWISDPGRSSLTDPTGRVYRLPAGGGRLELILDNVPYPNGIAFSPDGRFAYLAATRANAIWKFLTDFPDPLKPMVGLYAQLSGALGPDGMAMRSDGLLATAHAQGGRAVLFNALGDIAAVVTTPGGTWTTSVAFSADGRRLFVIDAQTSSVYAADLDGLSA